MKIICPHCYQEYDVEKNQLNIELNCAVCNKNFFSQKAIRCQHCLRLNPLGTPTCLHCKLPLCEFLSPTSSTEQEKKSNKNRRKVLNIAIRALAVFIIGIVAWYVISPKSKAEKEIARQLEIAKDQGIIFSDDDETLIKCPKDVTDVVIPACVTTIGENAFFGCYKLTSVTIPDSVIKIGKKGFSRCYKLTSVKIPDSVTEIGEHAFEGCEKLTSVTIPDGVKIIGKGAFHDCCNLTGVTIGNDVIEIGDQAFYGCRRLTGVTIGNSVTEIGDRAFYDCFNLTRLTLPDSVKTIGYWAFSRCHNLPGVTIPNSVTEIGHGAFSEVRSIKVAGDHPVFMVDKAGALIDKNQKKLLYFPQSYKGHYTIPDCVTTIGCDAFGWCENLTGVTIPDSVKTIERSAFGSYYRLQSVTVPRHCKVEEGAFFHGCEVIRR